MRTPEERQVFIRTHLEGYTDAMTDRSETVLRLADELFNHGQSAALATLLPQAAMEFAEAYWKLEIAKHEASAAADEGFTPQIITHLPPNLAQ